MRRIRLGIEFFVAAFVALIVSILLIAMAYQQKLVDLSCDAIASFDQAALETRVGRIWNIDEHSSEKKTMLIVACEVGNADAIKYLLSCGADVNKSTAGHLTPLESFCKSGYDARLQTLLLMINNGVDQSIYTSQPAIIYLADATMGMTEEQKSLATEEIILLLKNGAPMIYEDTTLLHIAAKSNMHDLFYTIIRTTAGLSAMLMEDQDGNTPWDIAVKRGSIKVQQVIRNLEAEYYEYQEAESATNKTEQEDFNLDEYISDYYYFDDP